MSKKKARSDRARCGAKRQKKSTYTCSVPEAGQLFFGIGRNASYRAAARGDIIVIDVGGLKRVPIAQMERKLAGEANA
jgi:hypothetical protein